MFQHSLHLSFVKNHTALDSVVYFDALIQDSFDNHGDLLLSKLSQKQCLKNKEIKSYSSFASEVAPQVKIKSSTAQDTPQ